MKRPQFFPVFPFAPLALAATILAGCGGGKEKPGPDPAAAKNELVLMIELATAPMVREKVLPMIRARFPEISIISRIRDDAQVENAVKSSFASGNNIDLVAFWPHQMRTFIDSGMALDLTPYLDADPVWKNSWIPETLEDGRFEGKNYALPYRISYPLLLVNRDIASRAGLVLQDQWTWDEFVRSCEKISALKSVTPGGEARSFPHEDKIYPLGINSTWACWFIRNGLMQIWDNDGELEAFTRGKIPFSDPKVKNVFENVKTLYDNNYLYPGKGSLTVTYDQVLSAFVQGKIAILANTNGNAAAVKSGAVSGAFEIAVMSWPNMGRPSRDNLLGSSDGYFIPANSRNPGKAVEILKYLCGPEILNLYAGEGRILPFKNIVSSNPDYPLYSRDIRKIRSREIVNFSPELNDYIIYNTPASFILYGDSAIAELEILRGTVKP
jgi:ABC-type glycerol-3-phosphate transport system substrate-binding protein